MLNINDPQQADLIRKAEKLESKYNIMGIESPVKVTKALSPNLDLYKVTYDLSAKDLIDYQDDFEFEVPEYVTRLTGDLDFAKHIKITGGKNLSDIAYLFKVCPNIETVDLSELDTTNLEKMKHIFSDCDNLRSVTFGKNFNTSKVKDLSGLFSGCNRLKTLDLSMFDTTEALSMKRMFYKCYSLENITFGNGWNTSNVSMFNQMFSWCNSLKRLDLSNFNTARGVDFRAMFYRCQMLSELNLSNFRLSSVACVEKMLSGLIRLRKLNLSGVKLGLDLTTENNQELCVNDLGRIDEFMKDLISISQVKIGRDLYNELEYLNTYGWLLNSNNHKITIDIVD